MRVQLLAFLLVISSVVIAATSTWNGSSWSGVDITDSGASQHNFVFDADYTMSGDFSVRSITISEGSILTLDDAHVSLPRRLKVDGGLQGTGIITNTGSTAKVVVTGVADFSEILLTANSIVSRSEGRTILGESFVTEMNVNAKSRLETNKGAVIDILVVSEGNLSDPPYWRVLGRTTINTSVDIQSGVEVLDTLVINKLAYVQTNAFGTGSGIIVVEEGASLVNYSQSLDVLQQYKRTWSDNTYAFVCMPTDGQTHTFPKKVYDWNESYSAPGSGWIKIEKGAGLTRGEGYIAFAAGEKEFTGYTDLLPVSVPVTLSSSEGKPEKDVGANLVGNPYACPLSFSAFVNANAGLIEPEIYYWSDGGKDTLGTRAGDYIVKNSIGASGAIDGVDVSDDNIASMQAYFVRAIANGTLAIDQSMILPEADNTNSLKSSKRDYDKIRIALENESLYNDVLVGFVADEPVENLKAQKKRGNTNFSFHIISDEDELAITAVDENLSNEIHIPLGIYVASEAEFTISLKSQNLTFAVDSIMLVNTETTERFDIEDESYQLSCVAGDNNNWEVVVYKSPSIEEPVVEELRKTESDKKKRYRKQRKLIAEYNYNCGGRKYHKRGNRKYYLELKKYSDGTYEKYMRHSR